MPDQRLVEPPGMAAAGHQVEDQAVELELAERPLAAWRRDAG